MTILVLGHRGQLGSEFCRQLGDGAVGLDVDQCDITDPAAVQSQLRRLAPQTVINCSAYTQVDQAEEDPDRCWHVNADAVRGLAHACNAEGCQLVQISTDYVFGDPPTPRRAWTEADPPSARGVYARSKLAGEHHAAEAAAWLVVRTCGLYGRLGDGQPGRNFVEAISRFARDREELRVVDDQTCTPSFTRHVARGVLHLAAIRATGIYHVVNAGQATWCEVAREIVRILDLPTRVLPITTAEYGAKAPRPAYSVLDTGRYLASGGPELPSWDAALREYLAERAGD